jgi:hypothetical protein
LEGRRRLGDNFHFRPIAARFVRDTSEGKLLTVPVVDRVGVAPH